MAFGFQSGAFQFGAFQQQSLTPPSVGSAGPTISHKGRRYYEIRGKFYLLSELELEYLLTQLAAEDAPEPKKKVIRRPGERKAYRIEAPQKWEPIQLQPIDWAAWRPLVVEAQAKNHTAVLEALDRIRNRALAAAELIQDEEEVMMLLLH